MPGINKLFWYWNRLRAMPLREIPYRISQKKRRAALLRNGPGIRLEQIRAADVAPNLRIGLPPFTASDLVPWRKVAERAVSAQRIVFALLAAPERDFSRIPGDAAGGIDWSCDPLTGRSWTPELSRNYRHQDELGEAKYVWELGRMPWLLPRAVAARALEDSLPARTVIDDILDFVRANTPRTGADYDRIHWQSGIELSFRIAAWTWCLDLVHALSRPTEDEWREIGLYIALAAEYLLLFESRFSSANNHLIAEGAGLEIAGRAWPWLPGAHKWAQRGAEILDEEIPRQLLPDGYSAEMCSGYLLQVLEWSLAAAKVRSDSNRTAPAAWQQRWSAAVDLLSAMCGQGQPLPQLGDDDEAQVFPLSGDRSQHAERIVTALQESLRQDGPLSFFTSLFHPLPVQEEDVELPAQALRLFKSSGIAVLRAGNARLTFDCGPHGLPPLYAHAHCDALSVEMSAFGRPVLIDPGTYCYHTSGPWRDWFRSTAAHNVVQIDGLEQSEMLGPFMWGRIAKTEVVLVENGVIAARHNGFAPFVVERRVEMNEGGDFVVKDEAIFPDAVSGEHVIQVFWHFAPGSVTTDSNSVTWRPPTASGFTCRLEMTADKPLAIEVVEGRESPPQGWHSPRFGEKIPAPTVVVNLTSSSTARVQTRIMIKVPV